MNLSAPLTRAVLGRRCRFWGEIESIAEATRDFFKVRAAGTIGQWAAPLHRMEPGWQGTALQAAVTSLLARPLEPLAPLRRCCLAGPLAGAQEHLDNLMFFDASKAAYPPHQRPIRRKKTHSFVEGCAALRGCWGLRMAAGGWECEGHSWAGCSGVGGLCLALGSWLPACSGAEVMQYVAPTSLALAPSPVAWATCACARVCGPAQVEVQGGNHLQLALQGGRWQGLRGLLVVVVVVGQGLGAV